MKQEETNFSTDKSSNQPIYVLSKRNKKIGLIWLLTPTLSIFVILLLYTIINTRFSNSEENFMILILNIFNFILSFLGLIAVIAIPVGIIIGIIYLRKKELAKGTKWDERSGKGENSTIPSEIRKWNWGAAGLNWIWGVYHSVWISLLMFIPLINIFMIIVLGIKGNEWAWRKNKWESVEEFVSSQNKWKPWGIAFLILAIFGVTGNIAKIATLI